MELVGREADWFEGRTNGTGFGSEIVGPSRASGTERGDLCELPRVQPWCRNVNIERDAYSNPGIEVGVIAQLWQQSTA